MMGMIQQQQQQQQQQPERRMVQTRLWIGLLWL